MRYSFTLKGMERLGNSRFFFIPKRTFLPRPPSQAPVPPPLPKGRMQYTHRLFSAHLFCAGFKRISLKTFLSARYEGAAFMRGGTFLLKKLLATNPPTNAIRRPQLFLLSETRKIQANGAGFFDGRHLCSSVAELVLSCSRTRKNTVPRSPRLHFPSPCPQ